MNKRVLFYLISVLFIGSVNAQTLHINEDFNAGSLPSNWTTTAVTGSAIWEFGPDGSVDYAGNQNLDGTNFAYFDDSKAGSTSLNNKAELVSPAFNNAANLASYLDFDYNFRQFGASTPDSFIVEVFDGSNWIQVFSVTTDDCGNYVGPSCANGFPHATVNISAYANANCRVRFTYFDGNDWSWFVGLDNVVVSSPLADDIGAITLAAPVSDCGMGTDSIKVRIFNYGANPASNFPMSYSVNGGTPVTETVTATVPANDSIEYTFTVPYNFSTPGNYSFVAYTDYTLDGSSTNDTVRTVIVSEPAYNAGYTEGFENGTGGWIPGGNNTSWARGVPNGTIISGASGGSNAFVTKLNGAYNALENSNLLSPCFDFSNLTAEPEVRFSLIYHTESPFDRAWLEVSRDGGTTWSKVLAQPGSANWYNNSGSQVWTGNSNGWLTAKTKLTNTAGLSKVLFRFRFQSDGSVNLEGIGIDNFAILGPQAIDIETVALTAPVVSNPCGFGNSELVTIRVFNNGQSPITTFNAGYRVNGGTPVIQNNIIPTSPIQPGTFYNHSFTTTANLSAPGNYSFDIWAKVTGDPIAINDTLGNLTAVNTSQPLPFTEDFTGFSGPSSAGSTQNGWTFPGASGGSPYWTTNTGNTSSFGTGPSVDHTSGTSTGRYAYMETSVSNSNPAFLISPCINLAQVNGAVMSFWYHKFGATMGDLFVDVYDNAAGLWINNIGVVRGQTQTSEIEPWKEATVNLSQFVGKSINFRFRGLRTTSFTSDMAVDDILIYEPLPQDAKLDSLISPQSGCDLRPNELVCFNVENFGTQDITSLKVGYIINNGPPVYDSSSGILIIPGAKFQYCMNAARADLSAPGNYDFKIFTELNGDSNQSNDTLYVTVINETILFPSCENFETLTNVVGDGGNVLLDGKFSNNWVSNSGDYNWEFGSRTGLPGPSTDHSTTGPGRYMVSDPNNGMTGNIAQLTSACYDLTTVAVANLEFWYHQYGSTSNKMVIDVFDGSLWNFAVDSIVGNTQTGRTAPWLLKRISLADYTGDFVQIRFRNVNAGGTYAIDDVCVVPPPPNQAQMESILRPLDELCFYDNQELVTVRMKNIGSNDIDSLQVRLKVDTLAPNGVLLDTTVWVYPGNQPVPWRPGKLYTVQLPVPVDMSRYKTYRIRATLLLNGDLDASDDFKQVERIHNTPKQFPYVEGFEMIPCSAPGPNYATIGFKRSNGQYKWRAKCGMDRTGLTGPSADHTRGNNFGRYFVTDASAGVVGSIATLESPCLDLSTLNKPTLKFWYHMFGFQMGELYIDINADNGWQTLDSILGEQQISNGAAWIQHTIDLSQYAGTYAKFRFRSLRGDGNASDMAVDDLFLYDLSQYDIGPIDLMRPGTNNFSCYSDTQSVHVRLLNYGARDLDFTVDTMDIQVFIKKDGQPFDTLFTQLNRNLFVSNTTGLPAPLPSDSSFTLWVNNSSDGNATFDMSTIGSTYEFDVFTSMRRDSVANNDDFNQSITTQIAGGTVSVDNNSICNGTVVRLNATGFFGAPKWERKYWGPGGTTFWLPEFGFGSDSAEFIVQPDTTAWYRVRICGTNVVSDSVKVDVTVVKVPDPIHDTICGAGQMTVEAFAAPVYNLQAVNWYYTELDSVPFKTTNSAPFTHTANFTQTDTFWLEGVIDSCVSLSRSAVYAVVNPYPVVDLGAVNDTVCQDTNKVLNAGAGFGYSYNWLITGPNGFVDTATSQTIGINPLQLMVDSTYTYRVTVTSEFGCQTISNTINVLIEDSCFVGISERNFSQQLQLFPNPTTDKVFLKLNQAEAVIADISIQSIEGKQVWFKSGQLISDNEYAMDLGKLAEGVYFVKISTPNGRIVKKLVIK